MTTKIYIDQGHNPRNPNAGAEGNGYREQDLVYTVGVILSDILRGYGYQTLLSRKDENTILGTSNASSLALRVNEANAWGADYFISLHTNASVNAMASGSEAYVFSFDSPAYPLALSILEQLNLSTGLRNRGVQSRPGLYVLRKTKMPAVLVELGFITSPIDANLMANSPNRFAQGVADGIVDYINRTETVSATPRESDVYDEVEAETPGKIQPPDAEYGYEDFMRENPRLGYLKIQAFSGRQSFPVENVRVAITKDFGDERVLFFEGETDENGIIDEIELPAPPRENSLVFLAPDKTAEYDMTALYRETSTQSRIQIYEGIKSIQPILINPEASK